MRRNEARRSGERRPWATASSKAQSMAPVVCGQPRGHCSAISARSGNAPTIDSGETCMMPNDRTPGVSMIHPPSGSSIATAEVDV